jgi:RNA polymerase sigma factor (sigma-70 family)
MEDMYTDSPFGEGPKNGVIAADGQTESPENYQADSLPRSGRPTPSNLARDRRWGPILDPGEEADLIRRAQAGDKAALTRLLQKFHRTVLKIAKKYLPDPVLERQAERWGLPTHDGAELDDLVAAGMLGLNQAITRLNPRRNNRLYAYAQKYIKGAISAEVKNWKKRGTSGETRIERWVYSHPYDTPEQIADALQQRGESCTPEQAAQAQQSVSARRSPEHCGTTDSDYDEDDNFIGARPATSHDMYRMYGCYGSNPHLGFHNAVSRLIDGWAADADKRAAKRLKAIGRRAYALELVARDHARIAARADPQQYLYPWKRRKSVAATAPRRKRKSQPRQPRKRYWRSWEDHAAIAA